MPSEVSAAFGQRHSATNFGIVMSSAVMNGIDINYFCILNYIFLSSHQVIHSAILILIMQLAFDLIGYLGLFLLCGFIGVGGD